MAKIVTVFFPLLFQLFGIFPRRVVSIDITRFVVPKAASFGALLELDCAYDLGDDQLYDAKWYKDNEEFFRCKSDGQVQVFEVEGIQLYHEQNALFGSCPVNLIIIGNKSAGRYLCEVSTEAPEFKTTAKFSTLKIDNSIKRPLKRIQAEERSEVSDEEEVETSTQGVNGCSRGATLGVVAVLGVVVCIYRCLNKSFLN